MPPCAHVAPRPAPPPAPVPLWEPVRCVDGRVYAGRTVRRDDARRFDAPADRVERWC